MKFRNYLFEYGHHGKKWTITICAESQNDAFERIASLQNGTLLGIKVMEIPESGGLLARLICRLRNYWQ